ncbi:EthD domain-containing protein [Microdochium trichocladiopsis]|uniref:EthD domain-containing protein n=1 Tax=Microdochium trichocladiopsis TaxID=1682393 RepID=A0A9P8YJL9_9PEZI|nr:EthD domain-containing protein [Microdochium trichocladiopsis]KAH7041088.1 EthD domain-containing protein [Microdochium trichocladiopsis]
MATTNATTTTAAPPLPQKQKQQQQQKLMSIAYIRRHPDMTPEQFYEHWEYTHGVIVKPWAERHGLIYTQVHLKPKYKDDVPAIGPENPDGAPLLDDYDGCALFEIDSFEQFAAAFEDEYYKTVIEPDERRFIDKQVGVMRVRGEVKKIAV